jgi:16S rRNA G527 N7-methylase RsmG
MDTEERTRFLEAIAETAKLVRLTQVALQRARAQCHGEVYEHVDVMCVRAYELQVRSEWLQQAVLGDLQMLVRAANDENRQFPDRRKSIDRRIVGMRNQLLPQG